MKSFLYCFSILTVTAIIVVSSCKKEKEEMIQVPVIQTLSITGITDSSAVGGGNIIDDLGMPVTSRGVCWSTDNNPETSHNKTIDGAGAGYFESSITGLNEGITYYVRAYAINSEGTGYGNQVSFNSNQVILATLTTMYVYPITSTSAFARGLIEDDGGGAIIKRGFCYSTTENPTITDNKTEEYWGANKFDYYLTNLQPDTKYYMRAYAVNCAGIAYGNQMNFTTFPAEVFSPIVFNPLITYGSVSDIDGNIYKTIQIGTQTWMAENLKTSKYNDGTIISNITDYMEWYNLSKGAYCWFNNDVGSRDVLGAFYNWYTVSTGKLCPIGWHVPSDTEWIYLSNYLGGENTAGGKLKEIGNTHWCSPNTGATNETGFTALPAGSRGYFGEFYSEALEYFGEWWSSSESWSSYSMQALYWHMYSYSSGLYGTPSEKNQGKSVRCIKDN